MGQCQDSLCIGFRKVGPFTDALPNFLQPRSRLRTVNHLSHKSQTLSRIVSALPDVVPYGPGEEFQVVNLLTKSEKLGSCDHVLLLIWDLISARQ